MPDYSGTHTISLKLEKGTGTIGFFVICGVVRTVASGTSASSIYNTRCPEPGFRFGCTTSWGLDTGRGKLYGRKVIDGHWLDNTGTNVGDEEDDDAGWIAPGKVVTMQLNSELGSLRFWLDGEPHGGGFTTGVSAGDDPGAMLSWAATMGYAGGLVEIVPTPVLKM